MKRGTPLKRVAFKKRRADGPTAERERHPIAYSRRPEGSPRAVMGGGLSGVRVEKFSTVKSEEYLRLVAAQPCKHCGIAGISQAAHPNTGKAAGKKLIDDRLCFPLCCDQPGRRGCHLKFDQGALFDKPTRRAIEPVWGADTRRTIIAAGLWPQNLPMLPEQADGSPAP